MLDLQNLSSLFDAALDFILGSLTELQAEGHVLKYGHVRIQSIVLEHHCDVSLLGRNIVAELAVDVELTLGNLLQAGDHTQSGGLTAAGRTDQDDEFLIFDIKVEIGDCNDTACIFLINMLHSYAGHNIPPSLLV